MKRAILIVLDSVGAGYLPDAAAFGDEGANTLGHIAERMELHIPHMLAMGLGYLPGINLPPEKGAGAYGRALEKSAGTDTTTGHWEMAGVGYRGGNGCNQCQQDTTAQNGWQHQGHETGYVNFEHR